MENTIQQQESQQTHKTISKNEMPKIPTVLNEIEKQKIADEFNAQYQNVFFTFLDKIITRNTIEQELTKQRLTTIITHTEQQLCSFDIPYSLISLTRL